MVGDSGTIIRYNGSTYEYDFVGDELSPVTLLGIAGGPVGERIAVGQGGAMFRFDGKRWLALDSGTSSALHAVQRDSLGRYWFAGQGGVVLHREPL